VGTNVHNLLRGIPAIIYDNAEEAFEVNFADFDQSTGCSNDGQGSQTGLMAGGPCLIGIVEVDTQSDASLPGLLHAGEDAAAGGGPARGGRRRWCAAYGHRQAWSTALRK
jgi:hypothetical protein